MPRCHIYIMNDLLLIVDEINGNVIKRIQMDGQSWYHKFDVGKNISNAVFIKGIGNAYQIVFLPTHSLEYFLQILQKLFEDLSNRVSLQNNSPSLMIIPISVARMEKQCIFTLYIKMYGSRSATYNSYTIAELETAMDHLMRKHSKRKLFRTL